MKIETGKGAYLNIQGKEPAQQMFVCEWYWLSDGTFSIINGVDGTLLEGSFPTGTWFKLNLNINLTYNNWEVLIDDVSKGSFANSSNQIYALDIFPYNPESPNQSGYFIDDFSYEHLPYSTPTLDLAVTQYKLEGKIAGSKHKPSITVRNVGNDNITSFKVNVNYNGANISKQVTGVSLSSLASYTIDFDDELTLANSTMPLTATISDVNNGTADDNTANDSKSWDFNTIVPAEGKMVVAEEGTGTWCQYCPRGAVFMDKFSKVYAGGFVPIAVHNNDPMAYTIYDQGMAFEGYPNTKVDRISTMDPSAMESDINNRLLVAPKGTITAGATWNENTRKLKVSLTTTAKEDFSSSYKVALVITEDKVRGTTTGYAQKNAYAGGNLGAMGGYESLPATVPASKMVYDHVARIITPTFNGFNNSFPNGATAGEEYTLNFIFESKIPDEWNVDSIHIVGLLIAPDKSIDNAGSATLVEAINNGFKPGASIGVAAINELDQIDATIQLFPNPAQDFTHLVLNLKDNAEVQISLIDMTGKVLAHRDYGSLEGSQELNISTSNLNSGIYLINVNINGKSYLKRLVVE